MTREQKLALILGFALVLIVGVAVSDHFSQARVAQLETGLADADGPPDGIAIKLPLTSDATEKPIRTVAAVPEKRTPAPAGPIGKGLDTPRSLNAIDWIGRFHDRLEDLPRAAQTTPVVDTRLKGKTRSTSRTALHWRSVREGDTLWSIAKEQYGDGSLAGKLAAFNSADAPDPDLLRVGVRLRIPPVHVLTGEPAPSMPVLGERGTSRQLVPVRHVKKPTGMTRQYTIKPGDTLSEIAVRELGSVKRIKEIIALNPKALSDPDVVPLGVTIRLPAK